MTTSMAKETGAPSTRDFNETIRELLKERDGLGAVFLSEALDLLLGGEPETARTLLRDYVNALIGFEALAEKTGIPPKSLMRMLGPGGNPRTDNLLAILGALREHAGIEWRIEAVPVRRKRAAKQEAVQRGFAEEAAAFAHRPPRKRSKR